MEGVPHNSRGGIYDANNDGVATYWFIVAIMVNVLCLVVRYGRFCIVVAV